MTGTVRLSSRFRATTIVLAAFLALLAWGLSSPTGSSPDDDFHLGSIWCAQGEREGLCESIAQETVMVPASVAHSPCFAFHNDVTGACQNKLTDDLVETTRANNVARSYPGGFYWVMSWFVSTDVTASVLIMRTLNALIFIAMAASTFYVVPQRLRRPMVIAIGATIVPLGMFIIASTNPSSWALYSPLFVYLLGRSLLESSSSRRSWLIAALTIVIGAFAAAARSDAAVFVLLAFGVSLWGPLKLWKWNSAVWATGVGMTLISGASVLAGRQSGSALAGLTDSSNSAGIGLLFKNFLEIPALYVGALGGWGLGWLDTTMPAIVFASLTLVLGGLVFGAIALKKSRRELLVPGGMLFFMIAVPLIMSQGAAATIGTFVQPRYVLPLLALTLITLFTTPTRAFLISPRQVMLGAALIVIANAVSLFINVARYSTGLPDMALNLNAGAWQPVGSAFGVLALGVIGFTACSLLGYRWLTEPTTRDYALKPTRPM